MLRAAAVIYSVFVGIVVLFQLALALGAPWGEYAMGGTSPGVYAVKLRIAAIGQAILLALTALVVLIQAGLLLPGLKSLAEMLIWIVVGLMMISTILNFITQSTWERRIWAPVTLILLLSSLVVAIA